MANDEQTLATFTEALQRVLPVNQVEQVLTTMRMPKRQGLWLNPLRDMPEPQRANTLETLGATPVASFGAGLDSVNATPALWAVAAADRELLVRCAETEAGQIYPINPSSVWAAAQLEVQPGDEVLDLAAAPGGKTLQLAAAMGNQGRVAAVEPVPGRFHRMRANLDRCGVSLVQFYQADGRGIGRKVGEPFDAVLLDAPCSSEARVRLDDPQSLAHWSLRKIRETSRKQKRLLSSGFDALKPGGRLLYCTCAFSYAENEGVVAHLLQRQPRAQLLPLTAPWQALETLPEVLPGFMRDPARKRGEDVSALAQSQRLLPNDLWDGFYCALLTKGD